MKFNSLQFVYLFPLIVVLFFFSPFRYRWVLLLAASYYFYWSSEPVFIILLVLTTAVDYFAAISIEDAKSSIAKQFFLAASMTGNLGVLIAFKYLGFFSEIANVFFKASLPSDVFRIILPAGISFYTFQTMSYVMDVYFGRTKACRQIHYFTLYVSFFPQLVAGPIERSTNLLPQFYGKKEFSSQALKDGLKLMLWGFFKKVVIADQVQPYVDLVYGHPGAFNGLDVLLATYFFAFQIYCDFSGYSDIAIGAAKIMGFRLMKNFDRPYFADSILDFWRRWHISLTTWFRDYIYFPLGGNLVTLPRWCFNVFLVFVISGMWHGANWNFLVWGAVHGVLAVTCILSRPLLGPLSKFLTVFKMRSSQVFLARFFTFHLVLLTWILFRVKSLKTAIDFFGKIFQLDIFSLRLNNSLRMPGVKFAIFGILVLLLIENIQGRCSISQLLYSKPFWLRVGAYSILLWCVILCAGYRQKFTPNFIYFLF